MKIQLKCHIQVYLKQIEYGEKVHKEGKSQRVITERGGCSKSAVAKHIKCKVDWKEEIG